MKKGNKAPQKLIKIAVFYDGNYFAHVSNYYNYEHPRKSRLSLAGLHQFIEVKIAQEMEVDPKYCKIIDAHYFRGRLNAYDYPDGSSNRIMNERIFDDILMSEGVTTHYLPLRLKEGKLEEKGVEVQMSLEAYNLAQLKEYDVLVLIASDSDYVSLFRKLNSIGVAVMLLAWNFEYTDERTGKFRKTVTSIDLQGQATFPVQMDQLIGMEEGPHPEHFIEKLFISKEPKMDHQPQKLEVVSPEDRQTYQSRVLSLKNGYGFINYPPNNLYFHASWLEDGTDFFDLEEGDAVQFYICENEQGQEVAKGVRVVK